MYLLICFLFLVFYAFVLLVVVLASKVWYSMVELGLQEVVGLSKALVVVNFQLVEVL